MSGILAAAWWQCVHECSSEPVVQVLPLREHFRLKSSTHLAPIDVDTTPADRFYQWQTIPSESRCQSVMTFQT